MYAASKEIEPPSSDYSSCDCDDIEDDQEATQAVRQPAPGQHKNAVVAKLALRHGINNKAIRHNEAELVRPDVGRSSKPAAANNDADSPSVSSYDADYDGASESSNSDDSEFDNEVEVVQPDVGRSTKPVAANSHADSQSKRTSDADSDGAPASSSSDDSESDNEVEVVQPVRKRSRPTAVNQRSNRASLSANFGEALSPDSDSSVSAVPSPEQKQAALKKRGARGTEQVPIVLSSDEEMSNDGEHDNCKAITINDEPEPPRVARLVNRQRVPSEIVCDSNNDEPVCDSNIDEPVCDSNNDEPEPPRVARLVNRQRVPPGIDCDSAAFTCEEEEEENQEEKDEEWKPSRRHQSKKKKIAKSKAKTKRKPKKKEEEEYIVDKILNQTIEKNGYYDYTIKYKVSWVGYTEEDNCSIYPHDMNGEDLLLEAFNKFPRIIRSTSGKEIKDDYVYREQDLERCTEFYDEWAQDHRNEAKDYRFVEIKTNEEHLRIGMWYSYRTRSGKMLLLVAALNSRDRMAKCLTFVSSACDGLSLLHRDNHKEYFYVKPRTVSFDRLLSKKYKQYKEIPPTSQWCFRQATGFEFTLYSNKEKHIPSHRKYFSHDKKPRVLFLGADVGMSYGYEEEGFNVAWQVVNDRNAANSLRRNYSEVARKNRRLFEQECFEESVDSFLSNVEEGKDLYPCYLKDAKEKEDKEKKYVDHIHASGAHKSHEEIKAVAEDFFKCVKFFKPKTAVYDGTMDLLQPKNLEVLKDLIQPVLRPLEYQMQLMILEASDYGDPIETKRVVLWFAAETVYSPIRPRATHEKEPDDEEIHEKITARDAVEWLEDVEPCRPGSRVNVDGECICNHCIPQDEPTAESAKFAIDPTKPAPEFTGTDIPVHFSKKRFLTIRECMCLKSFDEEYEIHGSEEEQMKIIAEAMPCRMAIHIARSIARSYGLG